MVVPQVLLPPPPFPPCRRRNPLFLLLPPLPPPPPSSFGLATFIAGMVSAGLVAYAYTKWTASENVKLEKRKKSNKDDIDKLIENFGKAKEPPRDHRHYVPVPAEKAINNRLQILKTIGTGRTFIVHGPRGVGKTTVVQNALIGVKSVVHIEPSPLTVDNLYRSILTQLNVKTEGIDHAALVQKSLRLIQVADGTRPTIVVDIDEKCNEQQLMAVLIELKKLVGNSNLSSGVVVLSTSRAALLLPVALHELRVFDICINDPPRSIIIRYLEKRFAELFPKSDMHELIAYYVQEIGPRFLDAVNLADDLTMEIAEHKQPVNVKELVEHFVRQRKKIYSSSAKAFVKLVEQHVADEGDRKDLYARIIKGDLPLCTLVEAFNAKDSRELLKTLADLHPHPIYVDIGTSCVHVGNFVAKEEFKKISK